MKPEGIRLKQSSNSNTWRDTLTRSQNYAQKMQYEEAVQCCLDFLHNHLAQPILQRERRTIAQNLNIVFACGGNASRWDNFLGIPKQLVDAGDGLPLVQRSINQFRTALPGAALYLLTKNDRNEFESIEGVTFVSRKDNVERRILEEVLEHTSESLESERDILLIYGDVYFSNEAVRKIRKKILLDSTTVALFGRRHQNVMYGNTGGEDFGVYAPRNSWRLILDYHTLLKRLYIGNRLYRYGTWEFVTLLSALNQAGLTGDHHPHLINNNVSHTIRAMAKVWTHKNFDSNHWVDIDDETEDFDFPCEYIERVMRMVQWVGESSLNQSYL